MKRNDTALYIFFGLIALGIISIVNGVNSNIIACISIAMLVFSIAQVLEIVINFSEENLQSALESCKILNQINLSNEQMLFMKSYIKYFDSNKKKKMLKFIATILNCIAFAILFLGFVIPFEIKGNISAAITIFSAAIIFFSMWLTECGIRRSELWEEVQKLSLVQFDNTTNNQEMNSESNKENDVDQVNQE